MAILERVKSPANLDRNERRAVLLRSPLFQAMTEDELDATLKFAVERHWTKGGSIFQKGDDGSSLMAVLKGRVKISAVSAEGKEVTLNVIAPGNIFGEIAMLDGNPRSADATALDDAALLVVERRHFLPFVRDNGDLYLRLLAVLCDRLRRTSMALEDLALFDLTGRLARLLLKMAEDYGRPASGGVRIDMKMSQRDISTLVASTRESVNKQLQLWRRSGVLKLDGGYIVLCRSAELRALVG